MGEEQQERDRDAIADLIVTYNELNSSFIEELHEEPSALEFMRFVARNTPFVVRGGAANWKATQIWTAEYLSNFLGDETVNVAVTPFGYVASQRYRRRRRRRRRKLQVKT